MKKKIILSIIFFLGFFFAPVAEVNHYLKLYELKRYEDLIALTKKDLKNNSQDFDARFFLALSYYQQKKYQEALDEVNFLEKQNANAGLYTLKADILMDMKDFSLALTSLRKAVKEDSQDAVSWRKLCSCAQRTASFEEGLKACNKSLQLNADDSQTYFERGNIYQSTFDFQQAIKDYQKAILIRPENAKYKINLGCAQQQMGKFEDSVLTFNEAIALGSSSYAYYNRANSLVYLNRLSEALIDYSKAISLNPEYAEAYLNRGITKQILNRAREACQDYRIANSQGLVEAKELMEKINCK